ncbi:MAG: hypothetical protein IRZ33_03055 [Alicyclobacillaceae bacterium]|nr:hypothetical protein [Alicyclobacillaceae bacterium]
MNGEQEQRFESMRRLVDEASQALGALRKLTREGLTEVDNDSPRQAEQLQRVQQSAGTVAQAMVQLADIARHARSFQAQAHNRHRQDVQ